MGLYKTDGPRTLEVSISFISVQRLRTVVSPHCILFLVVILLCTVDLN